MTLALLLLVTISAVQVFSMPVADNDLWGHIYFGRAILESGLPARNLYSYTAPHYPWINHEILAEVAFAWVWKRFGAAGLLLLKLLLGLATLAVMAATARRRTREPLAWGAALVLAIHLMSWGYLIRPQLFSYLALAIEWDLLQRWASGRRQALWALPAVFALWINTHGGVVAGAGILAVFVAFYLTQPSRRALLTVAAVSTLALLLNPYGLELLGFLAADVTRARDITEWASISLFDLSNFRFKATVLLFVAALAVRGPRPPWEVTIVALALVATFRHERHLPLFAILVTPFLAEAFGALVARGRERIGLATLSTGARAALTAGILFLSVAPARMAFAIHRDVGFGIFVSPEYFPVHAVRFLHENGLEGNLAVPFDWGEYAIWHLYPSCRVSIDGRYTTAYPGEVIDASSAYIVGAPGAQRILDGASLALADRRHQTTALLEARGWRRVYEDETAAVFVRPDVPLPELRLPRPPANGRVLRFP